MTSLVVSYISKGVKETPHTTASFPLFIDTSFLTLEVFLNHVLGLRLLAIIL